VVPPLLAAPMQPTLYTNGFRQMPFAIGSPANTGAVAQTTESGYFASFLAVPLGGSGGNFDQFPLRQGLNLSPGFPVSFGEPSEIAWFTFHRLCLYGEIYCSLLSAKFRCCQGSTHPLTDIFVKLFCAGMVCIDARCCGGSMAAIRYMISSVLDLAKPGPGSLRSMGGNSKRSPILTWKRGRRSSRTGLILYTCRILPQEGLGPGPDLPGTRPRSWLEQAPLYGCGFPPAQSQACRLLSGVLWQPAQPAYRPRPG
jgi:hypothetical protein